MVRSGSWGGVNESDEDERLAVLQVQLNNASSSSAYTQIDVVRGAEASHHVNHHATRHQSHQQVKGS